ncbi:unnamed protein product, partial [Anisakis simplex]|uniref:Integrator complex subunit 7 n=1 Tax=Anisakis simplex TaxID=6269 RepID=A0A0M3K6F5_ANISI
MFSIVLSDDQREVEQNKVKHLFVGLIIAMFDCATTLPNVDGARADVNGSLVAVGTSQPSIFLCAAHAFLMQHNKLNGVNRAFVLSSINQVLENRSVLDLVDEQQALLIINLATQEMTLSKENEEEWPQSACDLLVTLAKKHALVGHVMDALLQKFPPALTTPPHRFVVLALASVAEHNAVGFVPFLTDVLSRTIPLLQYVRGDSQRHAWSHALRSFCESVREYTTAAASIESSNQHFTETKQYINGHETTIGGESCADNNSTTDDTVTKLLSTPTKSAMGDSKIDPQIVQQNYADQMELAYDVRAEAANCIGELCLMISLKRVNDDLRKIVPALLGLYRRATTDQHLITQGICRFLEATCEDETSPLESYLEDILNALFPHVCLFTDSNLSSNIAIRNQSEAFRCFHVAAVRFADKIVYYLLHKMQNVQDSCKLGAINVMRHLLNSAGWSLLKFIINNSFLLSLNFANSFIAKKTSAYSMDSADTPTPAQLRTQCGQALQTIANTCESAHKVLIYICKCIRILAERTIKEGKSMDFETGFDNVRVAGSYQVFARLLAFMSGAPMSVALTKRAREAFRLMRALSSWFHPSVESVLNEKYDHIDSIIDELSPPGSCTGSGVMREENQVIELRSSRVAKWHAHVLDLLDECVKNVNDGEWRCALAAAMAKQLSLYTNLSDEKAFLMRCLGGVLSLITNTSFVVDHLSLMFRGALHSQQTERIGCAQAVGYCAAQHTDLVLTELENIAKWEFLKKTPGLFGFIKDAMPYKHYTDIEMVNLRATIMLTYGYVIFYCPTDVVIQRLEQTVLVFLRRYMENPRQETVVREALLETIYLISTTVNPTHLNSEYRLEARNELLGYIKDYIQSESPEMLSSSIRLLGCKAVAALVKLEPPLCDSDVWEIGQVLTKFILSLCRERSGLKTVIESRLPQSQMHTYLSGLFEMLNDRQSQVSSSAAQLLTSALTFRGDTLCAEAETLVTTILSKLPDVHACVQTYTDLLAALIAFGTHQLYSCIDVLLLQPLPSTTDAWHTLAHEGALFAQMIDYILELMMNGCGATNDSETPFEVLDTGAGSSVKIVKPEVCTLAAALNELIKAGEPEDELLKRIPQVLTALLQFLAAVVDTQYPVLQKESKDGIFFLP